ncbi:putative reverse transcriptase domain-containing protein [Tanacetum coccineum]
MFNQCSIMDLGTSVISAGFQANISRLSLSRSRSSIFPFSYRPPPMVTEVILFYNGLYVPLDKSLTQKGAFPLDNAVGCKVRPSESDAKLSQGPHTTYKGLSTQKQEGKNRWKKLTYIQFGAPYQLEGQYKAQQGQDSTHNETTETLPLVDLGASVCVIPFSTYTNLGLGNLAHTRLTIELTDRTIKHPRGIAENVLVRIGKFIFFVDFIILDKLEDNDVPLILGRPFLSTAHAKIDVFKKITLRVGEEKLVLKTIKPATSIIRRVYMLKEGMNLDSETELIGEAINESFDLHYGFLIIDDMDVTSGVVLGMPFCKKFVSCQKIMEKFTRWYECEQIDDE